MERIKKIVEHIRSRKDVNELSPNERSIAGFMYNKQEWLPTDVKERGIKPELLTLILQYKKDHPELFPPMAQTRRQGRFGFQNEEDLKRKLPTHR